MSDLLTIGASGVRAYQSALTTVSENITNSGSTGYTRRTTGLAEVPAAGGLTTQGVAATGNGVQVTGVSSAIDPLRNAAVRTSGSDLAKTEGGIQWLSQIESALSGNQLGDRLTAFFNSAQSVAADPTSSAARATMLESANGVAGAFAGTGQALDQISAGIDATADAATTSLDGLAAALAKVNDALGRTQQASSAAAQLTDQRDQLLESMSAITDVSVTLDAAGRAAVRLGGSNGPTLVAGSEAGAVTYVHSASGGVSFAVHRAGESATFVPQGGALAGVADGAQRVADTRNALNTIASNFVDGVNAVQAQGVDLNGALGAPMFEAGDSPTDISMVLADPAGIAAASVGGGSRDNSNLQALATVRSTGKYESGLTSLAANNAATLTQRQTVANAQGAIHDNAVAARDSSAGVNLDSEAVDLMRFQQAYSASSRVIQVARDTLQTILDIQ